MRKSYGKFKSADDLRAIKGIGSKRVEKMRRVRNGRRAGRPKKAGECRNNKILDCSVCLEINIRTAAEKRESESASVELKTKTHLQEKVPT